MKITLAQLNATVGDLRGNLNRLIQATRAASLEKSDLIVFPEFYLCGYPPRDLVEYQSFLAKVESGISEVIAFSETVPDIAILFGAPRKSDQTWGKNLLNTALLVHQGGVLAQVNKSLLPTYDVFDEGRHYSPGQADAGPVAFKSEKLGITVCEDAWNIPQANQQVLYDGDPVCDMTEKGATILINLSAAPFALGRDRTRYDLAAFHAKRHAIPFILVNQVGGNDELIFDGTSLALDEKGRLVAQLASFREETRTIDLKSSPGSRPFRPMTPVESIYGALVLGLEDYVRKCGLGAVIVGLSGGIDSAVTCALAVAALGKDRVTGVTMPSPYSSPGSIRDSVTLAQNLGIELLTVPIHDIYEQYLTDLRPHFSGKSEDVTEENIQARIRGNILMALANKSGSLVLATGNKSELAMGYCTLYGDMSGGLAVLADVYKTMVYDLAERINRNGTLIPQTTIDKAPSAELKPNQKDEDSLPPYDILDEILRRYIEKRQSPDEIVSAGLAPDIVNDVISTVDRNEHKRRQAAPGLKVTIKAFGSGRRMPIAADFNHRLNDSKK